MKDNYYEPYFEKYLKNGRVKESDLPDNISLQVSKFNSAMIVVRSLEKGEQTRWMKILKRVDVMISGQIEHFIIKNSPAKTENDKMNKLLALKQKALKLKK